MHRELIVIARELAAAGGTGKLLRARRARSASSAYYAVFHRLAALCAAEVIGWPHRAGDEFRRVYRALDHGRTRSALEDLLRQPDLCDELRSICQAFIHLQRERHRADYDYVYDASRNEVTDLIDRAESAIDGIDQKLSAEQKRTLLARLIGGRGRAS